MTRRAVTRSSSSTSGSVALQRAVGDLRLSVRDDDGRHVISELSQSGCGRLLFPARLKTEPLEAVIVNTAGGLTGGDTFGLCASVAPGAAAVLTTQACEKVYRSSGGAAALTVRLNVQAGGMLHWLPQETILFEGSHLDRKLLADVAADAVFVAAEAMVLGRSAMGETLDTAVLRDSWRIRRGGRLVFAEETACAGDWQGKAVAQAALGRDAAAFATLIRLGPKPELRCDAVRARLALHHIDAGASVVDDLLVVRMLGQDALALRHALIDVMDVLTDAPLPRVWSI